jgi:hypothetical protein
MTLKQLTAGLSQQFVFFKLSKTKTIFLKKKKVNQR